MTTGNDIINFGISVRSNQNTVYRKKIRLFPKYTNQPAEEMAATQHQNGIEKIPTLYLGTGRLFWLGFLVGQSVYSRSKSKALVGACIYSYIYIYTSCSCYYYLQYLLQGHVGLHYWFSLTLLNFQSDAGCFMISLNTENEFGMIYLFFE